MQLHFVYSEQASRRRHAILVAQSRAKQDRAGARAAQNRAGQGRWQGRAGQVAGQGRAFTIIEQQLLIALVSIVNGDFLAGRRSLLPRAHQCHLRRHSSRLTRFIHLYSNTDRHGDWPVRDVHEASLAMQTSCALSKYIVCSPWHASLRSSMTSDACCSAYSNMPAQIALCHCTVPQQQQSIHHKSTFNMPGNVATVYLQTWGAKDGPFGCRMLPVIAEVKARHHALLCTHY